MLPMVVALGSDAHMLWRGKIRGCTLCWIWSVSEGRKSRGWMYEDEDRTEDDSRYGDRRMYLVSVVLKGKGSDGADL